MKKYKGKYGESSSKLTNNHLTMRHTTAIRQSWKVLGTNPRVLTQKSPSSHQRNSNFYTRGGQHFRFIKIPFFVTWVAMYCGFILVQSLWYLIWQSQKATPTFPFEGLSKNWWCCCKPVWWSCSLPHFLSFPTSEVQIVVPCLSIGDLHIQCFISQRLLFRR